MEGRGRGKLQYQSPKVLIWINDPSNLALIFMFCLSPKKSLIRFAISLPNTWVALKITILNHNITTKSNNFYSCFFLVVFKVEGRTNLFFFFFLFFSFFWIFFLFSYDHMIFLYPNNHRGAVGALLRQKTQWFCLEASSKIQIMSNFMFEKSKG